MNQLSSYGAIFLAVVLLVALGYRWLHRRAVGGSSSAVAATRVISAVAVGPQQRVVTVETGPQGQRTWLVLGVSPQAVHCLHRFAVEPMAGETRLAPVASGQSGPVEREAVNGPVHGA